MSSQYRRKLAQGHGITDFTALGLYKKTQGANIPQYSSSTGKLG